MHIQTHRHTFIYIATKCKYNKELFDKAKQSHFKRSTVCGIPKNDGLLLGFATIQ